jgi:hypothetical protein
MDLQRISAVEEPRFGASVDEHDRSHPRSFPGEVDVRLNTHPGKIELRRVGNNGLAAVGEREGQPRLVTDLFRGGHKWSRPGQ